MTETNIPQGVTEQGVPLKVVFNIAVENFDIDWSKVGIAKVETYLSSTLASLLAEGTYTVADYNNRVFVDSAIWNLSIEVDPENNLSDTDIDKLLGGTTE